MSTAAKVPSRTRILVVEDEYFLAADVHELLVKEQFEVVGPFGSLSAALDAAVETGLTAAIVDINLHGWTTYEVLDRLRSNAIAVIIATGYDRQALPARFAECCFVKKPFDGDTILEAIHSVLPSAEQRVQPGSQVGSERLPNCVADLAQ
ncbi:MAG: response regulator [Sphingobium sp.]